VTRVVAETVVDRAALDSILLPRDDIVRERPLGSGRFDADDGPFRSYRRTVVVEHLADGRRAHVTQTVDFRLAIPYFAFLFVLPVRNRLARIGGPARRYPWWSPPCRLDAHASAALGTLAAVTLVAGYLNTLLTQTIAFAADEFGSSNHAQGIAGGAVRVGGMAAFAAIALADRKGRRRLVLWTATAGILLSVLGALAPSLPWLAASQFVARPMASALLVVIGIHAVEEMPAGARAYAVSLLAMSTGLGAGLCVLSLPLADLGERGWRLVYVIPLLGLLVLPGIARNLRESRRFVAPHGEDVGFGGHGRRLVILGASVFLSGLMVSPASFFQNRFLEDDVGFSASRITLLTVLTNTPAGLGIVVGGRIADARGRRIVGAVGLLASAIGVAMFYRSTGWALWMWSFAGNIVGAMSVPALGVYGPEMFPTALRGRANGLLAVVGLCGSLIGLLGVGWLSDELGGFATPMALAAIGPVLVAAIVLAAYPETARRELEELNPEDVLRP
jgi:MFS family permease